MTADQSPTISLPQGGGALSAIGETFSPDLQTGTANLSIPIEVPPGRNGLAPKLSLTYSSGNGNGPFGLGWALSVPGVRRKTSTGIPRYEDSDVFVLSGAEDLVPVPQTTAKVAGAGQYRPKVEGPFARILHRTDNGADYWQVWSADGLCSVYGTTVPVGQAGWADAAIVDPASVEGQSPRIFAWLLSSTTDTFGNQIVYEYARDSSQVDGPHRWDQVYMTSVKYVDYPDATGATQYLAEVRFVPDTEPRPDPFSDYRAGFEIRTVQRFAQIETYTVASATEPVRVVTLSYLDPVPAGANAVSLLGQVTVSATYNGDPESLPPLEFSYTGFDPEAKRYQALGATAGQLPSESLGHPDIAMVDLFGIGLQDFLQMNGTSRYWRNRGDGTFDLPRTVPFVPAGAALGKPGVQLGSWDGNGQAQLLVLDDTRAGYWPLAFDGGFDPRGYVSFASAPSFSLTDPDLKLLDLQGGRGSDVMVTSAALEVFLTDPDQGWAQVPAVVPYGSPVPPLSFGDPRVQIADVNGDGLPDLVYMHDGDVRYWPNLGYGRFAGPVTMYNSPHFPDAAEWGPTGFDPARLIMCDIDGDGCGDIVYVGDGTLTIWLNQAGNGFAEAVTVRGTPRVTNTASVRAVDILGEGISGVLWSYDAGTVRDSTYKYLDLTGGAKPYLLSGIDNHAGAVTAITYAPSTRYAVADRQAGSAWRTTLPFPVQVVASISVTDKWSQNILTSQYFYHHGYWDGVDKEFRGFGHVDQRDTLSFEQTGLGDPIFYSPPTETRTWFHLGPVGDARRWAEIDLSDEYWVEDPAPFPSLHPAEDIQPLLPIDAGHAALAPLYQPANPGGGQLAPVAGPPFVSASSPQHRLALRALRGRILRSEFYALDGDPAQGRPYTITDNQHQVGAILDGRAGSAASWQAAPVFAGYQTATRKRNWERGTDPLTTLSSAPILDNYGRSPLTISVAGGHKSGDPHLATVAIVGYATGDDDNRYLINRAWGQAGTEVHNDGSMTIADLATRVAQGDATLATTLRSFQLTWYDGNAFGEGSTLKDPGAHGLVTRTDTLSLTAGILATARQPDVPIDSPPLPPPYMPPGVPGGNALLGTYYADDTLTTAVFTRPDPTIDHNWGGQLPDPALPPGDWSASWTGTITPLTTDSYTFQIDISGGARLSIDGKQRINAWTPGSANTTATVPLTAGQDYPLTLEYHTGGQTAKARLLWSTPTQSLQIVPAAQLTPSTPTQDAWTAEYPAEFQAAVASGIGYTYQPDWPGSPYAPGYYTKTGSEYDFQKSLPGRGLLVISRDALGHDTVVSYEQYQLLPSTITNSINSVTLTQKAMYDYRTLKPGTVTDVNGNQTSYSYSPLDLLTGVVLSGKPGGAAGDDPTHPSTIYQYALTGNDTPGGAQPLSVHTIRRVDHITTLAQQTPPPSGLNLSLADEIMQYPERFLQSRQHSDGFGRLLQTRNQADPLAIVDLGLPSDPTQAPSQITTDTNTDVSNPNVSVNGWQVYDNKGRVLRKWEPYFDKGWDYTEPNVDALAALAMIQTFYDAPGRPVRTIYPDNGETLVLQGAPSEIKQPYGPVSPPIPLGVLPSTANFAPSAWATYTYDPNDNADRTHHGTPTTWQGHWNTPSSAEVDPLGRVVQSVARLTPTLTGNTADGVYITTNTYDIAGNRLTVTDTLGRTVNSVVYDLLGRQWRGYSIDAGTTSHIIGALANRVESRDSKHALQLADNDEVNRPYRRWAADRAGTPTTLRQILVYGDQSGETDPAAENLNGHIHLCYDEAGLAQTSSYDLHANPLSAWRQVLSTAFLTSSYLPGGNWDNLAALIDWEPDTDSGQTISDLESRYLDPNVYQTDNTYDALSRTVTTTAPTDADGNRATISRGYDQAGTLTTISVGGTPYLLQVISNARGQRQLAVLGNNILARYSYDSHTFRLTRLRSEPADDTGTDWQPSGAAAVQDHSYSYDLVGNILTLVDTTLGCGVTPTPDVLRRNFTYDALYELIGATGRETDIPLVIPPWVEIPPDEAAIRNYAETYVYDPVGSLKTLVHTAFGTNPGSYTRTFTPAVDGNRLQTMTQGQTSYPYTYDAAGNQLTEDKTRVLEWDHGNRLASHRTENPAGGDPSLYTQYRYDNNNRRTQKIVRNGAEELRVTIYVIDLFERLTISSEPPGTQHDSLHIYDELDRIALIRSGPPVPDDGLKDAAVLYSLSDHLQSCEVTLDNEGSILKSEEYLPYGETSHGSYAKKRYRYTGKERDEESGLYYHGARYYSSWQCRWLSTDPNPPSPSRSLYCYCSSDPLNHTDPSGRADEPAQPVAIDQVKTTSSTESSLGAEPPDLKLIRGPFRDVGGHHSEGTSAFRDPVTGKDPFQNDVTTTAIGEDFTQSAHDIISNVQNRANAAMVGRESGLKNIMDPLNKEVVRASVYSTGEGTLKPGPNPYFEPVKSYIGFRAAGFPSKQALSLTEQDIAERAALASEAGISPLPTRTPGSSLNKPALVGSLGRPTGMISLEMSTSIAFLGLSIWGATERFHSAQAEGDPVGESLAVMSAVTAPVPLLGEAVPVVEQGWLLEKSAGSVAAQWELQEINNTLTNLNDPPTGMPRNSGLLDLLTFGIAKPW